ncbi:MAG: hypothetical protein AAF211_15655, partial [Myxococcota bacterium]
MNWTQLGVVWATGLVAAAAGAPALLAAIDAAPAGIPVAWGWFLLPVWVAGIGGGVAGRLVPRRIDAALTGAVAAAWAWWLGFAPGALWSAQQPLWAQ